MVLEVKDLVVAYGFIKAVKGISFNVDKGEIVTLIGANGAGKTTTLKTISGLITPEQGSITFNGEDIKHLEPNLIVKKGICQVPEGRGIFTNLTVQENLTLATYLRKKDKFELKKDFDRVFSFFPRLKDRRSQSAGTLSGGEQQMLAVGRALMTKGELVLLDEPSMGLAPVLVEMIFEIIEEINKSGTTILLVEQNAFMALEIANRAYVLETGEVVFSGKSSEVKKDERILEAYLGKRAKS